MLKTIQTKDGESKIKLGVYPYTYVRTVVMRGVLLKLEDYHKLLKMSFSEITKFLQDSEYKEEINSLAVKYSGAELLERALNLNLIKTFNKFKRISPPELNVLINGYLKRLDIWNVKTILRGRYTGTDIGETESLLIPVGTLKREYLTELLKKESVEDMIKNLKFLDQKTIKQMQEAYKEKKTLMQVENMLDHIYYEGVIEFCMMLPEQGRLFRDFLETELEMLDIMTILRLKKENLDKKEIKNYLFIQDKPRIKKMLNAKDIDGSIRILEKTKYGDAVKEGVKEFSEKGTLIKIELGLYRFLLRKTMLLQHQHPLSIDILLGYMFAKDMELRNLKTIIKGKQLGLNNEFMESQLVI